MTARLPTRRRLPVVHAFNPPPPSFRKQPDLVAKLARDHDLECESLELFLEDAFGRWVLDKESLATVGSNAIPAFFRQAAAAFASWQALTLSEKDSLHRSLLRHEVNCLQTARGLDYIAQAGPIVVAHWPEASAKHRAFPRRNLVRFARGHWAKHKPSQASAYWDPMMSGLDVDDDASGVVRMNEGGRFIVAVVRLVTGEEIEPKHLKADLDAISKSDRKPKKAEI